VPQIRVGLQNVKQRAFV